MNVLLNGKNLFWILAGIGVFVWFWMHREVRATVTAGEATITYNR